jgi:AcrR family transcriptional regulator
LAAARELAMSGHGSVTISDVSAAAGVSRTTVYKWWHTAAEVMLESLLKRERQSIDEPPGLGTRATLARHLDDLAVLFADGSTGAMLRSLIGDAAHDERTRAAFVEAWLRPRRAAALRVLQSGQLAGEVRQGVDLEVAVDALFAPLYHRLTFGHAPLWGGLGAGILDIVWPGLAAAEAGAADA